MKNIVISPVEQPRGLCTDPEGMLEVVDEKFLTALQKATEKLGETEEAELLDEPVFHPDTTLFNNRTAERILKISHRIAKQVCQNCVVREHCLQTAQTLEKNYSKVPGIWGGLDEMERTRLRKRS